MIARREAFRLDVKRSQCQALSHVRPSRRFRLGLGFTAGLIWGAGLLRRRNLNTEVSLWECIKCFPSTIRRKDLRKGQSTVILGLDRNLRPCRQFKLRATFSKSFPSTRKREAAVFKFLRLGELFLKSSVFLTD